MPGACCFPEDGTHSGMARTRDEKAWLFLLPEVAPSSASSGGTLSRKIPPATHQPMTAGFTDTHFNQEGGGWGRGGGGGLPFNVLRIKQDSSSKF